MPRLEHAPGWILWPQVPQAERYLRRLELALQLSQEGRLAELRRPLGFGASLLGFLLLLLGLGHSIEQPDHAPALASNVDMTA